MPPPHGIPPRVIKFQNPKYYHRGCGVQCHILVRYSLVDTRRRTTVVSAEARNGSWLMARTRGVELFRLLSAPICMSPRCMHACMSVALTFPSTTRRSLSTDISIPARQQQQLGGLRLPRSIFRGLFSCQVGCRSCLKRRAGARIKCIRLGTTDGDAAYRSMLILVVLLQLLWFNSSILL